MSTYRILKSENGQDEKFFAACKEVNIPPTSRQLKKWKKKTGLAYKGRN